MKKFLGLVLICSSLNVFGSTYSFEAITSCGQGEIEQFEVPHAYCNGATDAYSNWYNIERLTENSVKVEGAYKKPNSDLGFIFACENGNVTDVISETKCISGGD